MGFRNQYAHMISHLVVPDSAISWTVAHQAALSMEFSRQEYWSGLHAHLQGILLTQGLNTGLPHCRRILYHLNQQGFHPKRGKCNSSRRKYGLCIGNFVQNNFGKGGGDNFMV